MLTSERKKPKRSKIRYAEYYDLQKTLDSLYADSLKGKVFVHLMELISSEENIRMAYRTIKGNTGSSTAGVDKRTIQDLSLIHISPALSAGWKSQNQTGKPAPLESRPL